MENKEWLENLEKKIIESNDKILFKEAIGCFENKYYRSAYVIAWIALIESLKRRIIQFAGLGDKKSELAIKAIEDAEKQKKSVDLIIFHESHSCGIINTPEFDKVNFLWTQRCIYAHPYETAPDENEVMHILDQIVKISLGKELYFNKLYVDELCNNIAEKPFFLTNDSDQVREYAKKTLSRIPENLYPFAFKTFLSKIGSIRNDDSKAFEVIKLRHFIIELFIRADVDLSNPEFMLEHRATNYPYESYIGYVNYETWPKLPLRIKEMLISFMENLKIPAQLEYIKLITSTLVQNSVLEATFQSRYFSFLGKLTFESAIWHYGIQAATFERFLYDLKTQTYDIQNPVIDTLKTPKAIEFITKLDSDQQFELGRAIVYAANNGHYKSQNFIPSLIGTNSEYPQNIKAGIAYGYLISSNDNFKYVKDNLVKAVRILNILDEELCNRTYAKFLIILENTKADDFDRLIFNFNEFDKIASSIEDGIDWKSSHKESFDSFRTLVQICFGT